MLLYFFFDSLLSTCPKKIETETWPKAADSPLICCGASRKNNVHEILDSLKNFVGSASPTITLKTENDTVGRYRFG